MTVLSCDYETRSDVNLKSFGAHPYFQSPYTDALILCYAIDDGPVLTWARGQAAPQDFFDAVADGAEVSAHNCAFETLAFDMMHERHSWPKIPYDQFRCSMATAAALALPLGLATLCETLNLDVKKDKAGADLIKFFSVPRSIDSNSIPTWNEPEDHPEKFERFCEYCRQDVFAEMAVSKKLVPLSNDEIGVWHLDQTINRRGVCLDADAVTSTMKMVDEYKSSLNEKIAFLTDDAVKSGSQIAGILSWVRQAGVNISELSKDTVAQTLKLDIPDNVREVLRIRQEAGKSSTTKLAAMNQRTNSDGRMRGAFQYHGTGPGRWVSRGVNISNLPRPRMIYSDAHLDIDELFEVFKAGDAGALTAQYGDELGRPLDIVADSLRGFLMAKKGHRLIAVDYSSIQGRLVAWLSNEEWKMQAVRELDADPSLPDLYRRSAAGMTGLSTDEITKKHPLRQIGKVAELALGFQGGVSAFVSMAKNYNVNLDEMFSNVWISTKWSVCEVAMKHFSSALVAKDKRLSDIISRNAWLAAECIKLNWRAANPRTVEAWKDIEDAARNAIRYPGEVFQCCAGRVAYIVKAGFLWCRLPSGRCIAYPAPRLHNQVWAKMPLEDGSLSETSEVVSEVQAERLELAGQAKIEGVASQGITAARVNESMNGMMRYSLYGGLLMENLAMGIERDILVAGMRACEAADYPIVMHTYDETVAEVPSGFGSVDEMAALMCRPLPWSSGLSIAADGWTGTRYRK
jgi:DNA polymerase